MSIQRLLSNHKAAAGAAILALITVGAVLAPWLTPHDPIQQNLSQRLRGPSWEHWLGTDQYGRDMFARILYGARISLRLGLVSVGIALLLGGAMGLVAAYYGGWLEQVLMRLVDVLLALPAFLLALTVVAVLGPGLNNVMIAVGISYVPIFARLTRATVLTVRELDYVAAARAIGAGDFRIMLRHILPNAINPLIVQGTLAMASSILAAAGLSFLGLGAQPPTPEWGSMLASARPYLRLAHHTVTFPGLAIMVTVLAFNMLGDGLRDLLDPRSRGLHRTAPREAGPAA